MIVACPSCQKKIKAPDSAAGKKAKCPSCGTVMMLPAAVQDAEVINQDAPQPPPPSDPLSTPLGGGGGISDLLDEADDMYSLEKKPGVTDGGSSDPFAPGAAPSPVDSGVPRRPCPACGEMIIMSALKCRFCGEAFDPGLKRKQRGGGIGFGEDDDLSAGDWLLALICTGIGCIFGIVWMIQGKPKGAKMVGVCVVVTVIKNVVMMALSAAGGGGP